MRTSIINMIISPVYSEILTKYTSTWIITKSFLQEHSPPIILLYQFNREQIWVFSCVFNLKKKKQISEASIFKIRKANFLQNTIKQLLTINENRKLKSQSYSNDRNDFYSLLLNNYYKDRKKNKNNLLVVRALK